MQDAALDKLLHYFNTSAHDTDRDIPHPDPAVHAHALSRRHELREAAVLIPVTRPTVTLPSQVVLTVRSANLSSHAGQVSLPGGSREPQDPDHTATALRESAEEIGLAREHVQVLGRLGEILLPSGFRVTPVIGLVKAGLEFVPCPREVDEIFLAPLSLLLDPDSYQENTWQYDNHPRRILEVQFGRHRIWGATAVILHYLAKEVSQAGVG